MVQRIERTEIALRENCLKEVKLGLAEVYREKDRMQARMRSHGSKLARNGWANERCAVRVAKAESATKVLTTRCRRKAKDHMIAALAQSTEEEEDTDAPHQRVPMTAKKFLDSLGQIAKARGARPWDLRAHGLDMLVNALEEASICSGDASLRQQCEESVLAILRRLLETAAHTQDPTVLEQAVETASIALPVVELTPLADVPSLLVGVQTELHRATLREVPTSNDDFHDAVKQGDIELCTWLFDREQANPSAVDPRTSLPPLVVAAKSGDIAMCNLLIARRADVDARCAIDGFSALHWAAHLRYSRVVSALIAGRANPRIKDRRGQDALMKLVRRDLNSPAAGCHYSWVVQTGHRLPGAELSDSGVMDLEAAKAAAETDPSCVGFCFRSVDIGDEPTGYLYISLCGDPRTAPRRPPPKPRPPPEVGEDGQVIEADGEAAMEETVEVEEPESFWTSYLRVRSDPAHDTCELIAAGGDPCAEDHSGLTALHHHLLSAPSRGSPSVVAALLRGQADVNVKCRTARSTTPLLIAVGGRCTELVSMMLQDAWPPADVDARTSDGYSALALAESKGSHELAALLRSRGAKDWSDAEFFLGRGKTYYIDTRDPGKAD